MTQVLSPATGEPIADVLAAARADVDAGLASGYRL